MSRTSTSSAFDNIRTWWALARYNFWLDLNSVPRKDRRSLRSELNSNIAEAAADAGLKNALSNLGSIRGLAAETTSDGRLRSRWIAGWVAALTAFAALTVLFMVLTLYYIEGVLDGGTIEPVSSSLFPFLGSSVTVDPSDGGIASSIQPGFAPLGTAIAVWLFVAKPWRAWTRDRRSTDSTST